MTCSLTFPHGTRSPRRLSVILACQRGAPRPETPWHGGSSPGKAPWASEQWLSSDLRPGPCTIHSQQQEGPRNSGRVLRKPAAADAVSSMSSVLRPTWSIPA